MTSSPYDIPAIDGPVRSGSALKRQLKVLTTPVPAPAPADPARAALAVRNVNAAQLAAAQDFIFRLADYDGDTETIAALSERHPEKMAAARDLTTKTLGTPAEWHMTAMARWQDSDWSRESLTAGRLATVFWNASAALSPVAAAGLSLLAGLHPAVTLGSALGAVLAVLIFLPRPVDVGVPVLHPRDVEQLHAFVAEAVFADLLEEDGVLTAAQGSALRRGRDHLLFIANTTHAMSMRPFDPATIQAVEAERAA